MRTLSKIILTPLSVLVAALFGNWLGSRWRTMATGGSAAELSLVQTGPDGETIIAINPLITNFGPALLASLLGRPHWLMAFVGGTLASRLMGDEYEDRFCDWVNRQIERLELA
jgi:hypothetical protein